MKSKTGMFMSIVAAAALAACASFGATVVDDGIKDGVHGYTPKRYVRPPEPEVRERLEWFKDQKLALMMHWGIYSTIGSSSWSLSDAAAKWARRDVTWTKDSDEYKRQYWGLIRSFNPVRFEPKKWAEFAKDCGFRYVLFTMKHHDGFCLFDSKYSDFKVTSPECPFSVDKRADIARQVFDAFRAEGLGIAAYFSKPDFHNENYWDDRGLGHRVSHGTSYDVKKNPERWAKFREFTKNQIVEIVRDYGKVDIIWLDGGQVRRGTATDIGIEDIIAEARKYNPALISVDRNCGGVCENVITPEQKVPEKPLAVPWESCMTIGKYWGYHFEDEYKSVRQIVHTFIDIVAKGGNLALNVGPQPDGRLPHQAVERIEALGAWLKVNGEAIYETRPFPPFRKGDWAFTRNRKTGAEYVIRLWKEDETRAGRQTIPGIEAAKIVHVGGGREFACEKTADGVAFDLPADFKSDANADVFRISGRQPSLSLPEVPAVGAARLLPAWAALTNAAAVADLFVPDTATSPAEFLAPGAVRLPVDFTAAKAERANWDLKFRCDLRSAEGIEFDFVCGDLSQFTSFCCYFKSGKGWYKATFAPDEDGAWRHMRVPKKRFRKEGEPGGWDRVTAMRISCWRAGTNRTACAIANVATLGRESESERERMREKRRAADRAWLADRPSKSGEHRAFWCHSARGLGGGRTWDGTIRFLKETGFNAVIPNLCWGGVAFYDSKVLPVSPDVATRGDALKDCLAACRKYGVKCHVWKVCWKMGRTRTSQTFADRMAAENRVQRGFNGAEDRLWLCPSHPDNQKLEIDAMCELARMGVDGVHFDYIRYPDAGHCFCAGCRARFEAFAGATLTNWPAQVRADAALALKWAEFRASNITAVVRAVAGRVRAEAPGVEISAAVFRNPATDANRVAQDWPRWCREGLLDFVCPMDYIESAAMLKSQARMQREAAGKARLYPGIGLSCWMNDDDELEDAVRLAKQIQAVRDLGLGGFTVFNLDRRAEAALPLLRLGVTKSD